MLKDRPDILIVSLWRAYLIGIFYKLLQPKSKLVVFLHSPVSVHLVDTLLTKAAVRLATEVWADSQATLDKRAPALRKRRRVISFVTDHLAPQTKLMPKPSFVFWGRINSYKGIDRALSIFKQIRDRYPEARYSIIGPDGGAKGDAEANCHALEICEAVAFIGQKNIEDIPGLVSDMSFYLQTSRIEGMGMSVVEAMQLGLVPVVTPVGEIGNYCRDGKNAIFVIDDAKAVSRVDALLRQPSEYRRLSEAAIATWQNKPLYRDDVLYACRQLIECEKT